MHLSMVHCLVFVLVVSLYWVGGPWQQRVVLGDPAVLALTAVEFTRTGERGTHLSPPSP